MKKIILFFIYSSLFLSGLAQAVSLIGSGIEGSSEPPPTATTAKVANGTIMYFDGSGLQVANGVIYKY